MKQISINGTARTELGKKATKEIRKNGNVPCVIYGEKKDENGAPVAIHFTVNEKEINKLIYTPHIYLVDINIDGVDHKAVLKEVQFPPVKDNVLMGVPVQAQGLAAGVRAGGRLMMMVRKLNVRALYDQIPEKLFVDVTALQLGKTIKAGDLHYEGLEMVTPKEVIVCAVKMTRAAAAAAAAAAE